MPNIRHVLLSNDDGIDAPGLQALEHTLREMPGFRVTVVAPSDQQSASSHSLTLTSPLRILERGDGRYAVTGTPTDSVLVAMEKILRSDPPDVVMSGINHGPNMGEDVHYSGTVAVAFEATILGAPSVAFSSLQRDVADEETLGEMARRVTSVALEFGLPEGCLLNVNIPDPRVSKLKGLRITKLGSRHYENFIEPGRGPLQSHYTIGGQAPVWREDDGSDIAAVRRGYVSPTPLHLDLTDYRAIVDMERWRFEL